MPPPLLEQVRPIAERIVAAIDPDDIRGRARRSRTTSAGRSEFRYTLAMDVVDPSIDPAVDFLVNRKQGHCEYFATAMTLLVRSIGIPARMVNGFKGGDYNAARRLTTVRQKHAHSWVRSPGRADRAPRPQRAGDLGDLRPDPRRPAQRVGGPGRRG